MALDIPGLIYGEQEDYKKLYYSESLSALKVPITLAPGYGILKAGTVLSKNTSGSSSRTGMFIPYDPTLTITGAEVAPGRAYLTSQQGTGTDYCYVTLDDSYKFLVGDDIIICDSDLEGAAANGGAITAIDRTTYPNFAVITFTSATSDTYTLAKFAFAAVEGCFAAVGILEKSVDTGIGVNAKGAVATMILGNCVLYNGMILNLDTNAKTDLSAAVLGQYVYIR